MNATSNLRRTGVKREEKSLSFGEGLKRLEAIVAKLEQEDLELEEALEAYEQGVVLYRRLRTLLVEAERKIEVLASAAGDQLVWKPFERAEQAEETGGEEGGSQNGDLAQ